MLHTRQAMSSSFLHSSALTWHASKEYTLVPPNAIEREMTLDKARRLHFQNSIVPLLLEEEVAADWANLVESLLAEQGTQSEYVDAAWESGRRSDYWPVTVIHVQMGMCFTLVPIIVQCTAQKPTLSQPCA